LFIAGSNKLMPRTVFAVTTDGVTALKVITITFQYENILLLFEIILLFIYKVILPRKLTCQNANNIRTDCP